MPKYVVVTGGVLSGLGKGIAAASIGRLLKDSFKRIVTIKCDGYLNVDPGTMNPIEHGEVFVLDDGGEVDMDFGHYERFLNINAKFSWNLTSGKIFSKIIERERKGDFLGKTIQIIPHVRDQVVNEIKSIVEYEKPDLVIIEIGGTIGDIENFWFVDAVRKLRRNNKMVFIHLTYVPYLRNVNEFKTKPSQRDVALLKKYGISPDILIVRSEKPISNSKKRKLALSVDIDEKNIINGIDVDNIYDVPIMFFEQGITGALSSLLDVDIKPKLETWNSLLTKMKKPRQEVNILIAGKYTYLEDSYASIIEALKHAGAHSNTKVNVVMLETTELEDRHKDIEDVMKNIHGVIVPGGFGSRGIEGKIKVIEYVRKNKIPFLGLCLGLQLAVIEFARNVCGLQGANSTEFNSNVKYNVIDLMDEQRNITKKGGTMRLGSYPAILKEGTKVYSLYNSKEIKERHRHRYEVNPNYVNLLESKGMVISGVSPDNKLVEFIELEDHPFFITTQAHPEFKSRFEKPSPLFLGLVRAALKLNNN